MTTTARAHQPTGQRNCKPPAPPQMRPYESHLHVYGSAYPASNTSTSLCGLCRRVRSGHPDMTPPSNLDCKGMRPGAPPLQHAGCRQRPPPAQPAAARPSAEGTRPAAATTRSGAAGPRAPPARGPASPSRASALLALAAVAGRLDLVDANCRGGACREARVPVSRVRPRSKPQTPRPRQGPRPRAPTHSNARRFSNSKQVCLSDPLNILLKSPPIQCSLVKASSQCLSWKSLTAMSVLRTRS